MQVFKGSMQIPIFRCKISIVNDLFSSKSLFRIHKDHYLWIFFAELVYIGHEFLLSASHAKIVKMNAAEKISVLSNVVSGMGLVDKID
jgi:hypothetical protein